MKTLAKRKAILTKDGEGKKSLDSVTRLLRQCLYDALEARIRSGKYLMAIKEDKMYLQAGHQSFVKYIEHEQFPTESGIMTAKEAYVRIAESELFEAIIGYKVAGASEIPEPVSAYQLRPLLKHGPEKGARLYIAAATEAQAAEIPFSGAYMNQWIEKNGSREPEITITQEKSSGEYVASEEEEEEFIDADFEELATPTSTLTQAAKETLDKVDEGSSMGIFPKGARKCIEDQIVQVSVQELENWGTYSVEPFAQIGRLIFSQYTETQAARFVVRIKRCIAEKHYDEISAKDLVTLAIASGGAATVPMDDFQIDVSRTKPSQ